GSLGEDDTKDRRLHPIVTQIAQWDTVDTGADRYRIHRRRGRRTELRDIAGRLCPLSTPAIHSSSPPPISDCASTRHAPRVCSDSHPQCDEFTTGALTPSEW